MTMTATTNPARRFQITPFTAWIAFLALLCGLGLFAGILVFINGLSITGLSDRVPWGMWITIDLSAIGLGAGAFLLSAAVYLLGLKKYEPVARLAVFVGLLGYTSALLTLLLDIGRPDRFWHGWIYWNTHSVLWEIIMCITLYSSVLTIEFMTIVAEHPFLTRWPWVSKLAHQAHKLMPALAVVGACLSLLHQSSLGATYGIIKARPVWYKPTMPLMFIAQAIATSPLLTVALALIVSKLRGRELIKRELLLRVATFSGFALLVYLYMRFWDYLAMDYSYLPGRAESMELLTGGLLAPNFWIGETFLGGVIPLFILFNDKLRKQDGALVMAGLLMALALIVNRWDTNMAGLLIPAVYSASVMPRVDIRYTPTWVEWATAGGVLGYWLMAFTLGVRFLPVLPLKGTSDKEEARPVEAEMASHSAPARAHA
jgi:molybdopterin-containing oxidoreductase family membrane subunit